MLPQNLQPQLAAQEGLHPFKKRRKTQSSQQGQANTSAAKPTDTNTSPLKESWQAACSQIQTFLADGLAPPDSNTVDDTGQHTQLQALLHTVLAARKVRSAGLTAALCAVAGKWVKHVLQQQQQGEQSFGLRACFDLIGKGTHHAMHQPMQLHSMLCTLYRFVMPPVPGVHRSL